MAVGMCGERRLFMADRKQRARNEEGSKYDLQRHESSDLLSLTRHYLLKFSESPKTVPTRWGPRM
jgi:hypothetical protein